MKQKQKKEPAAVGKLRAWLARRGFGLDFDRKSNEVCFTAMKVTVQQQLAPQAKLATLLHECGHVLVYLSRWKRRRLRVAGQTWAEWCRLRRYRSKRAKLLVLHEEIVAWERGRRLGKRLKLKLPEATRVNVETRCLMSYVRHAALA